MSERGSVAVFGAGGHAKVVIATLQAAGYRVGALFDDDPRKRGKSILDVPVEGTIQVFRDGPWDLAVIAVGDNVTRAGLEPRLGARWVTLVHPYSHVHSTVRLGPGTVVFAGAIVQPEAVIGAHTIINTGAIVEHDCVVGSFAHLGPGSRLAGGVQVGEGTLVGIGATVKPGIRIGAWATIGAGSVVVRDVPDRAVAFGNPARARA